MCRRGLLLSCPAYSCTKPSSRWVLPGSFAAPRPSRVWSAAGTLRWVLCRKQGELLWKQGGLLWKQGGAAIRLWILISGGYCFMSSYFHHTCNATFSWITWPSAWPQPHSPTFHIMMSSSQILPGSEPAAHCYCGHQFGNFAGQLGDGCALWVWRHTYTLTCTPTHKYPHLHPHMLTYALLHTYTHVPTSTPSNAHLHTSTHTYTLTCTPTHKYPHLHHHMHTYTHVPTPTPSHAHLHTCTHTYTCTPTHKYPHLHISSYSK